MTANTPGDGYTTFSSIPALKAAAAAVDNKFFSRGAMQFFRSRIEGGMLRGRYFITSEQYDDDSPRLYTVRAVSRDENGRLSIDTVGDFQGYETRAAARAAALEAAAANPAPAAPVLEHETPGPDTEESRIARAENVGRELARVEIQVGHRAPRNFERDGEPNAGMFSHLSAAGFTRLGSRMYSSPAIRAYLSEYARQGLHTFTD